MIKKLLACFVLFMMLMAVIFGIVLWQSYRFWIATPQSTETRVFEVQEGSSLSTVSAGLADAGIIASASWFELYVKSTGLSREIQVGAYDLQPGMNYQSILTILTNGKTDEDQLTIPEGYTLIQIGEAVREKFGYVSEEEWNRVTGPDSPFEQHLFVLAAQKPDDASLEGYLFPDTYRFFHDATAEDIVEKMINEMQENYESLNVQLGIYDGGPTTIHEFLTLSSIIEREVRDPHEMKTVAGIFYNRLAIGMALQADSTVNYVTGKETPGISLEDTELDSLYNTYKYPGLPPGPISNPGLNALTAAAQPLDNDYFYFLTTPEGEAVYASTLEEHVANKNTYLR